MADATSTRRAVALGLAASLLAAVILPAAGNASAAGSAPAPPDVGLVDPSQGEWHLRDAVGSVSSFFFGNPGDFPMMGDWNCDGIDTPGMYRQSDGFVYLSNANQSQVADIRFFFGNPGDVPLSGDFNGDGCDTVSIYRPSEGRFFIINELGQNEGGLGAAETDYLFGNPGDKPFVGDFDNDGVDTVGLHRESTGLVYFRQTHTQGIADAQFIFGDPGDRLVAGDWNNDGTDTPALFRPSSTTFFFRHTNTQGIADASFQFGESRWLPVAGHFSVAIWEHLTFQFGPNRFVRNPGSLNEHLKFRQAIAHAINKNRIVAAIPSAGRAIDSYVEAFLPALSQGAWAQYDYNVATSVRLLGELCAELKRDCSKSPPRAVFSTTSNNDARVQLSGLLNEMLSAVGIQYEAQLEDSSLFFGETLDFGTWDLGEWAWLGTPSLDTLVGVHDVFDPDAPPPSGSNFYRWGTPAVTGADPAGFNQGPSSVIDEHTARFAELRDLMNSTSDRTQIVAYIREAEKILADQVVVIPLYLRALPPP